jgi:hypothetical protein
LSVSQKLAVIIKSVGESIEAVAVFIRKFFKVVRISKAEQVKLDKKLDNLNLRQRMPDGWSFESGDVFQRLRLADIDIDLFPDKCSPPDSSAHPKQPFGPLESRCSKPWKGGAFQWVEVRLIRGLMVNRSSR